MKEVHVECKPDGLLVGKLGFTKKKIIHSYGKSRVFKKLLKCSNSLAMVDEDPLGEKHPFEKKLNPELSGNGLKLFTDSKGNKIIELKIKLEDWILSACSVSKINPENFSLPSNPRKFKKVLNRKLDKFEDLVDELLRVNNQGIMQLKSWLQ